ncbi:MAG: alpha/beta fold hydrolase [Bryobacteraceae bacterium]
MRPFDPLLRNAHLATVAASFWPRHLDEARFPVEARLFHTEPETRILVHVQRPSATPPDGVVREVVLVHGLEASSEAPYMRSLAQTLLEAGYWVHRMNIRSCGGTEFLCRTLYHAGFTQDLFAYLADLDRQRRTPVHLVGFSLGGNIVLKFAGQLGRDAFRLLASVTAVSTPIDLAACTERLNAPVNWVYQRRFLRSMKARLELRRKVLGELLTAPPAEIRGLRSVYDLDDRVTAPAFGFASAEAYYESESARNFVGGIRVPCLLVQAQDDPMIPFEVFRAAGVEANRAIKMVTPEHGGHIGFLARRGPRIWVDAVIRDWIGRQEE